MTQRVTYFLIDRDDLRYLLSKEDADEILRDNPDAICFGVEDNFVVATFAYATQASRWLVRRMLADISGLGPSPDMNAHIERMLESLG